MAQCMMGVMPLYGSQPVTEGEKKTSWNVIGSYVISATGWFLFSHGLLNTGAFDMQTSS